MRTGKFIVYLLMGIVLATVGILIFIYNDAFLKIIVITTGLCVVAGGIRTLVTASKSGLQFVSHKLAMIKSIAAVVIGAVSVFAPLFAAETAFTIVIYILALNLVFSAIVSIENAISEKRADKNMNTGRLYSEAAISLLMAVILFANPQSILTTVVKIIGILALAVGIIIVLIAVKLYRKSKVSE